MDSAPRRSAAFCRVVSLMYALLALPVALALVVALTVVRALFRGPDPWWPASRWAMVVSTLPRLAQWLERRVGGAT